MAEASIPVDLTNPGQVFASLGFVEAAEVLLGEARGGFDWRDPADVRFRLAARGGDDPVVRVLRFLDEAAVTSFAPANSPTALTSGRSKPRRTTLARSPSGTRGRMSCRRA